MGERFTSVFLSLFCEKNSDGTKHLRLKGNDLQQRIGKRIKGSDMINVAIFLKENPEIISVNLCYNEIGGDGMEHLTNIYFNEENNLQFLNIMHCDIGDKGLKCLASSKHLYLKSLRVNGNRLGSEGSRYIGKLIESCPTLELLDIAQTDQTLDNVESILINAEQSNLKILDISRVIPNSYYSKYNASTLADDLGILLQLSKTLTELHINKCEFDGHDVELLLSGLKTNSCLLFLDIGSNWIGDHGMEYIAKWLKTRPKLQALNISSNSIKDAGAKALSYGMPFSRLKYLDITNNQVTDAGMMDLLYTIKKSVMLRFFYFWGNKFGAATNKIVHRMILSKVLDPNLIDIKIYYVDEVPCAAYAGNNHYSHRYYCVMDHGCPVELKIKRNIVPTKNDKPRALLDLLYTDRYPPVDRSLSVDNNDDDVGLTETEALMFHEEY